MLNGKNNILSLLLALYLIIPIYLLGNSEIIARPSLSYQEVRRYKTKENTPRLEINLVSKGFSPGTQVKLSQKLLNDKIHTAKSLFTILDCGVIGRDGKPYLIPLNDFCVGEPMIYTITTRDQKTASVKVVPYPFEKKDNFGHKISIELANPEATIFQFSALGFEPHEN
jgi:hypothetical protein